MLGYDEPPAEQPVVLTVVYDQFDIYTPGFSLGVENLEISLGGTSFEISTPLDSTECTWTGAAEDDLFSHPTFAVRPVSGLGRGTHTDKLYVTGRFMIPFSIDISFEVVSDPIVTGVVVTPDDAYVQKGGAELFTAQVLGVGSPSQEVVWSVLGGGPGTSVSPSGVLTVSSSETAPYLTLRATSVEDSTKYGEVEVGFVLLAPPPPIATVSLPDGYLFRNYSGALSVAGDPGSDITWYLLSGRLPLGLSLNPDGSISGTPLITGVSNFTVMAVSPSGSSTRTLSITVRGSGASVPVVSINTHPAAVSVVAGEISESLSVAATATEGAALDYQWYANTVDSNEGGTSLPGETAATLAIPTDLMVGTYYYYCVVGATSGAVPVPSNVAAVTVTEKDVTETFPVTVLSVALDATGSGSFAPGAIVAISAGTAPVGMRFKEWTAEPTVTFANPSAADTSFTMPAEGVTVTAVFEAIPATVTEVTINPSAVTLQKGQTYQFGATVAGENNPHQAVNWSIESAAAGGTVISSEGILTIDPEETAATIRVRATATVVGYTHIYGEATVTVSDEAVTTPTVTSVAVTPDSITLNKGDTHAFSAVVNGTDNPPQGVTWTVEGGSGITAITAEGVLTVAPEETGSTLTVKATSTLTGYTDVFGTATVTVAQETTPFVAVSDITGVPTTATVGTALVLSGTVTPANATNMTIGWSVSPANTLTGVGVSGNTLTATTAGTAVVRATIANGLAVGTDYSKDFNINVQGAPATEYAVTVNSSYAATSGAGNYAQGATVTIDAGSRSNYSFNSWTVSGATLANINSPTTTFTMPSQAVTVTANWTYTGGGGSGSSSGGRTITSTSPPLTGAVSDPTAVTADTVPGQVNGTEISLGKNPDGSVSLGLTAADVAKYPMIDHFFTIEIKGHIALDVSFPIAAILATKASAVQIKTGSGTVILTRQMLTAYSAAHGDMFTLRVQGGSLVVEMLRNGRAVHYDDPANPLFIRMPVVLAADTSAFGYVAVQKTATGDVILPYSVYKDGQITCQSATTGTFDVIYNGKRFADVDQHWAMGNITFVAARSLFGGLGNDLFSPDTAMTRAMFAQVLANIEGIDLTGYVTTRFSDVDEQQWYAPAVAWAAEQGIVGGYGNGRFGPMDYITREQLAVMLMNYVAYKGYELTEGESTTFGDESGIADWALDAVKLMQGAGIVGGKPGGIYDPQGTATRGEVATIFANFINGYVNNAVATGTVVGANASKTASEAIGRVLAATVEDSE